MSELNVKLGGVKTKLRGFSKFVTDLLGKQNISTIELFQLSERTIGLEKIKQEFDEIQTNIELTVKDDQELETQYQYRETFENEFYSSIAIAKKILSDNKMLFNSNSRSVRSESVHSDSRHEMEVFSTNSLQNPISENINHIKLPTINLPKFNGAFQNWLEFRDTFQSLIHNNVSVNNVQKFHYLKASLEGDAALVIKSLEISSANYNVAWSALIDRFDNNKLLVYNHVRALFSSEPISKESAGGLRKLNDDFSKNLRALEQLNQPVGEWDTLLVYLISTKLDPFTLREWENVKTDIENPKYEDIKNFLKSRADLLEMVAQSQAERRKSVTKGFFASDNSNTNIQCVVCGNNHYIQNCASFLKMSVSERDKKIRALKLCINCLRKGHNSGACKRGTCRKCNQKHNSLLHFEKNVPSSVGQNDTNNDTIINKNSQDMVGASDATTSLSACESVEHVFLCTVFVQIAGRDGNFHTIRALLDSGSQSSFVTKDLSKRLNVKTEQIRMAVKGLNNISSAINEKCEFTVQAIHSEFSIKNSFFIIETVSGNIPTVNVDISKLKIPNHIQLADPTFFKSAEVEMLIGADLFWDILCVGRISLGPMKPVLQKTKFGWVVSGPICFQSKPIICNFSQNKQEEQDVQKLLGRFWEIEEIHSKPAWSSDDAACEEHYVRNTTRTEDGRFVVTMPFKEPVEKLGESFENAKKRFLSLERKLQSKPDFKKLYVGFINEYKTLGHMCKIKNPVLNSPKYYMPHHGVLREDSLTTKLRVVFDASATTTSGYSLNNLQFVGPTIQQELFSILLRFRQHRYVVCADIAKMYRQVLINPQQTCLQRILWRENPTDLLEIYELQTVTYGTTAAPFLAIRSLLELANEIAFEKPDISRIIKEDFYVDDFLSGSDSLETAAQMCLNVTNVLKQGGFELRKFFSNDADVLRYVGNEGAEAQIVNFSEHENAKTLGITWNPIRDKLKFNISENPVGSKISKRAILSSVAQIFDPLGLVSPSVILAKLLLQKLWLTKVDWDETVCPEIYTFWRDYRLELPMLNELSIDRCVISYNPIRIELHGFSDASERAYGACIYVRSIDKDGSIISKLLCAKSKVAPLKTITLPRLELSAALILAKLAEKVKSSLRLSVDHCYFWTDSSVVLGWLVTEPNKLKTFVSNRVAEIQKLTESDTWRHVPSDKNPADLVSRGVKPSLLKQNVLWWHGPSYLLQNESSWPDKQFSNDNTLEMKKPKKHVFVVSCVEKDFIQNYSDFNKLCYITAYIFRFFHNCRSKINSHPKQFGGLTTQEINQAVVILLKISQQEYFEKEIRKLKLGKNIQYDSKILNLNPFLDSNGILRVGGRLNNSNFEFEKKHPALLSSKSHFAQLLIKHTHLKLLHAGPQQTLATLREKYWPIGGRIMVKNIIRKCITCFRLRPKSVEPIMSPLPKSRVNPRFPFELTGVDYAGPILIKSRSGRGCKISKAYISLFVCFVTKAVHLELVTDLTKDAFLLALKRFVSRRGLPVCIYSDNGTNFCAANNELKELGKFIRDNEKDIEHCAAKNEITWKFIPPQSPHFGGLWEAGVKSVKTHLKRVLKGTPLTFEHLYTLLTKIEAILNSRPLSPLSDSPNDFTPLTPSHFLIGRPLITVPENDVTQVPVNRLSLYQHLNQITQHLWQRWSKEYISELQQRNKWKTNHSSLQEDSLVLIKEDNQPPMKWKLGRVEKIHIGSDGVGRVAVLRIENGLIKRTFNKICPLPID